MSKLILIWTKTNGFCWYCGSTLKPGKSFSIDHILPKKYGGTDDLKNLVPACRPCNSRKCHRTVESLRELLSREAAGCPKFKKEQLDWLKAQGVSFPKIPKYIFYFEKKSLKP